MRNSLLMLALSAIIFTQVVAKPTAPKNEGLIPPKVIAQEIVDGLNKKENLKIGKDGYIVQEFHDDSSLTKVWQVIAHAMKNLINPLLKSEYVAKKLGYKSCEMAGLSKTEEGLQIAYTCKNES